MRKQSPIRFSFYYEPPATVFNDERGRLRIVLSAIDPNSTVLLAPGAVLFYKNKIASSDIIEPKIKESTLVRIVTGKSYKNEYYRRVFSIYQKRQSKLDRYFNLTPL